MFRPESFHSVEPPQRICSAETEYIIVNAKAKVSDALRLGTFLEDESLHQVGLQARGEWLTNGARLYPDLSLAEYAAPEMLGPREATAGIRAGNIVMRGLRNASNSANTILYRRSSTIEHDTGQRHTYGYHLNFCIPASVANTTALSPLETHHATATFASGGIVTPSGFDIAPKAIGIGTPTTTSMNNRTLSGKKPFAIIRSIGDGDTNHISHGMARYEVRSYTPSTEWSDFMGLATTSLLLRIIEHRSTLRTEYDELRSLTLADPIGTFRAAAKDMDGKEVYNLWNCQEMTALEIQSRLADLALAACDKLQLPEDEVYAACEWRGICDDMAEVKQGHAPVSLLADRVGWAAKYTFMERNFGTEYVKTRAGLGKCMLWDAVAPEGIGSKVESRAGKRVLDDQQIQELVTNPPQGTRAKIRSDLIHKHYAGDITVKQFGWTQATFETANGDITLSMHPYQSTLNAL